MNQEAYTHPKDDFCPLCREDIVRQDSNRNNWVCSDPNCRLAYVIVGDTDIQKAIYLLREIDAFLSFNIQPPKEQMQAMRETIQGFVSHFPDCWKCGDMGYESEGVLCSKCQPYIIKSWESQYQQ